jgi:3'-phosphoadenosine 5'-phosphosulfate sulfotransferase (PAPS reductase)/FAD synthetase
LIGENDLYIKEMKIVPNYKKQSKQKRLENMMKLTPTNRILDRLGHKHLSLLLEGEKWYKMEIMNWQLILGPIFVH